MNIIEYNFCGVRVFFNLDNVTRLAIVKYPNGNYLCINNDKILIDEKIKEALKKIGVEL
jgi:hypothetical protein